MKISELQAGLHVFASKSAIRPEFAAIKTDGRVAVATDTFRLVEITEKNAEAGEALLLDAKDVKNAKVKVSGEIVRENGKVYIAAGSTTQVLEAGDASQYPQYSEIWPKGEPAAVITVNADYLHEICKHLAKVNSSERVTLKFYGELKPLVLEAEGGGIEGRAMLMPVMV